MNDKIQKQDTELATLYTSDIAKAGTEEMGQEDLNIPYLILLQDNTKIPEIKTTKKTGYYYRTDTTEQIELVEVNFVYVTTEEKKDEKTGLMKIKKAYFGFYKGTTEPFKLRMSGWGLAAHKQLQTEVAMYQQRFNTPMFALTVKLTSENQQGVTKKGDKYDVEKIICEIIRDPQDQTKPLIEKNPERINFLYESIDRFKKVAPLSNDDSDIVYEN